MAFPRRVASFVLILAILSVHPFPSLVCAADKGHKGKVTMLADHKYYDSLISGIRKANKEITGCFFLFKASEIRGNLPMAIVNELIAARKRGVSISVELEQAATGKGTVYEQNRKAATMMTDAGIKVRFDAPKKITHVKAMVIDGRYVYIGSHNLTQSALKYNNELSVMIESPELAAEVTGYLGNL
jgi:Phosphatidylserine/phosphatidylglycerophosphate/cardiolipin synthases and related enzymes